MLDLPPKQVYEHIRSILDHSISTSHLNQFVALCQSLSKVSLIHEIQHARLDLPQSLVNQDQLDGFAMDCIADLFARDPQQDLFLLRRYFEPHALNSDLGPMTALPLLRALVQSRVHQSLISLFSKVDQGGCKIWRNLNLVPKRDPQIKTFSHLSATYFYFHQGCEFTNPPTELNPTGEALPDALLQHWLNEALGENYGLPKAIQTVLARLNQHSEYQHFLSRAKLYHILKSQLNIAYLDLEDYADQTPVSTPDPEAENLSKQIKAPLLKFLAEQVHGKYLQRSKIQPEVSDAYVCILEQYFCDLIDDGYVDKLSEYLDLAQARDLQNGQWHLHRGRLEYLIKLGKDFLKTSLEDQGFLRSSKMRVIR